MKKIKPEISVIMSVYNDPLDYLEASIRSILSQTYKDFEFNICVDGIKENTKQLKRIKELQKNDSRIKIHTNTKNQGLTKSLNRLIELSNGKYIARMDSDDISLPKRLEKQAKFMEKNKEIILLGGQVGFINSKGQNITHIRPPMLRSNRAIRTIHPIFNQFIHSCFFLRASAMKEEGIRYDERFKYSQDYELSLRIISQGLKVSNLKDKILLYRINNKSISFKKRKEQRHLSNQARRKYKNRLPCSSIGIIMTKILGR